MMWFNDRYLLGAFWLFVAFCVFCGIAIWELLRWLWPFVKAAIHTATG